MPNFSTSPVEMFASLCRHRSLIYASTKREVLGRYRGSVLGLLWSFLNPLFMLTVYTLVFSVIFQARWGAGGSSSKTEFSLLLFAGLIVFNLFSECVNRAPNIILGNTNFVKKVVFPLEILPFVSLLSALFHALISVAVWLVAFMFLFGVPYSTVILLPLILLPFCFFLMGISLALASLNFGCSEYIDGNLVAHHRMYDLCVITFSRSSMNVGFYLPETTASIESIA